MTTKSENKQGKPIVVSPLYQAILIILSTLFLSIAFYKQLGRFHYLDPKPDIYTITPQIYEKFGGFSSTINVGLEIAEFETFDMTDNKFVFYGIIWFKYIPGVISLETLETFRFERAKILRKSKPDIQLIDGKILVRYHVKVEFTTALDHTFFPLDDHRIHIVLAHPFVSISEVVFETSVSDFVTKTSVATVGWQEVNQFVQTGYSEARISDEDSRITRTYPVVLFALDYERFGIRHLLTILLPLLLIFYVSLFSLCITRANMRLAIIAVTAMVSYRFVIDRMSPSVGYFMFSDYFFFLFLCAGLIVFLLNVINEHSAYFKIQTLKISIALLHGAVAATISYLLLY